VSCPSADDCWAVGTAIGPSGLESSVERFNEVLHWSGANWTSVPVPEQGLYARSNNSLAAVSCTGSSACWAVGTSDDSPEVLHFDGAVWSLVSLPGSAPAGLHLLTVTCTSKTDCWAAGEQSVASNAESQAEVSELLHWNGNTWAAVPPSSTGKVNALTCPARTDCWAVGGFGPRAHAYQAIHWDGTSWAPVRTPEPGDRSGAVFSTVLHGVACTGAANCWAVGTATMRSKSNLAGDNTDIDEVLHWTGQKWSLVPSPDPGGVSLGDFNQLNSVACPAATACWAVGTTGAGFPGNSVIALSWDGRAWAERSF